MRTKKRRRRLWWLFLVPVLLLGEAVWFRWQCWGLQTTHTAVPVSGLARELEGLRLAHLSDLHGHEYGEGSAELLALVGEEAPDLIVITGDLIDRAEQLAMVPALARGLAAIAPTYYVTGNHEWATGAVKALKGILAQGGVTVLSNRSEVAEWGGARFVLAGVDDPNGYADQKTPEELAMEIEREAPGLTTLLLAHRNDHFPVYAAVGYDLVLSGHGHGGIVRLPFTDGLLGTDRKLFPSRTAGVYTQGECTLFVSRGLGNNTQPIQGFRLFNRPELAVIELTSH